MSRAEYESFVVKLVTRQGYPLAAGGICLPGFAKRWRRRFELLTELRVGDHSLYGIDFALARALAELGNESLVLAGATVDTKDVFEAPERTGGVLGSPSEKIRSANGSCESLLEGFHLWAVPGGPGLAASGSEETLQGFAERTGLFENRQVAPSHIYRELKEAGLETGMLVYDGTGQNAHGFLMAFAGGTMECSILEEPL